MFSRVEDEVELLSRHIEILKLVIEHQPIGIIKLSELSQTPQHKIRYSLRVLEQDEMIKPSQRGAVTTKNAGLFLNELSEKLEKLIYQIKELKKQNRFPR
jgi:predicted transcriptional regulator